MNPKHIARDDRTATMMRRPASPLGAIVRPLAVRASPAELKLSAGTCVIGAGTDADLIIEDSTVSRRHIEMALVPEGVEVRDLGSHNGTFYLGQRIEKAVLSPGSRLMLGSVELAIDADVRPLHDIDDSDERPDGYRGLIGQSPAMLRLFGTLARLEGSLVNVLVEGASGVGKELVARAIHDGSAAADGPLVVVNCGALGRQLVLSELFGHAKGAFTGAEQAREGAFVAANGGTLFLDEIGELPLDVQPVLLRALEAGEVTPLGVNKAVPIKVRIVAASNRDLRQDAQNGRFREDLYYRLAVVTLRAPPLSERASDVPLLAQHFAKHAGAGALPEAVIKSLSQRQWQGNARELRNAVLAYLAIGVLPDEGAAVAGLLEAAIRQSVDLSQPYQQQKDHVLHVFSRVYFETVMARTGGNQSEAARLCGVERSYLRKLLSKYGVKR